MFRSLVNTHNLAVLSRFIHVAPRLAYSVQVKMPSLSPTMTEGSIVNWMKKEGEEVCSGDVLCEVQTDKAVVALESDEEGVLAKILVPAGSPNIKVGGLIAILAGSDENWEDVATKASTIAASSQTPTAESSSAAPIKSEPHKLTPDIQKLQPKTTLMGPAVRLLLQSFGLEAANIPASGPNGQILKGDVLKYIAATNIQSPSLSPKEEHTFQVQPAQSIPSAKDQNFIDIPLSNMRKVIAKRLTESKFSIPHTYVRGVANVDQIMKIRSDLKSKFGIKLSINDFILKACALGLRLVPDLNAIVDPKSQSLERLQSVDICMAVATPSGLITPILTNVDERPISEISSLSGQMAKKARDGKLKPHEFQGGSFTVSNLGMFGIREFTAIINLPQTAILAVGAGVPEPIQSVSDNHSIEFTNQITLTLSIDSRYVDEIRAGQFLKYVSNLLGNHPDLLLDDDLSINQSRLGTNGCDEFEIMMLSKTVSRSNESTQTIEKKNIV